MNTYEFNESTFEGMSLMQRRDLINDMTDAFDEARARILAEGQRLTDLMRSRGISLDD